MRMPMSHGKYASGKGCIPMAAATGLKGMASPITMMREVSPPPGAPQHDVERLGLFARRLAQALGRPLVLLVGPQ